MFEFITQRNNLLKQKKCIEALNFLLNPETMSIYQIAIDIINYHDDFLGIKDYSQSSISDSLYNIRKFYQNDLDELRVKIKSVPPSEKTKYQERIEADGYFLQELTPDFIDKYNAILYQRGIVEKYKSFVGDHEELLNKYNDVYGTTEETNKKNM